MPTTKAEKTVEFVSLILADNHFAGQAGRGVLLTATERLEAARSPSG